MVDEDPIIAHLICYLLDKGGYEAINARSGEEALTVYTAHKKHIALVLMDLRIAGMDSRSLIQALLRYDPQARIVVSYTSCAESERKRLLQQGMRGMLRKPFITDQLLQQVGEALA